MPFCVHQTSNQVATQRSCRANFLAFSSRATSSWFHERMQWSDGRRPYRLLIQESVKASRLSDSRRRCSKSAMFESDLCYSAAQHLIRRWRPTNYWDAPRCWCSASSSSSSAPVAGFSTAASPSHGAEMEPDPIQSGPWMPWKQIPCQEFQTTVV